MSVDEVGTPGQLNRYVLSQLELDVNVLPDARTLRPGFAILPHSRATLVFVVTVNGRAPETNLRQNLTAALNSLKFEPGARIWIPLMGTGTGRLSYRDSLYAIYETLLITGALDKRMAQVIISAPREMSATEYEVLRQMLDRLHNPPKPSSLSEVAAAPQPAQAGQGAIAAEENTGGTPEGLEASAAPDIAALLHAAILLAPHRVSPSNRLSTTLMLFSLAAANENSAPQALRQSVDMVSFAAALRHIGGGRFSEGWNAYFSQPPSVALKAQAGQARKLPLTANCGRWVGRALEIGAQKQHRGVTVDDLVEALWEQKGGFQRVLERMGVSIAALKAEYEHRRQTAGDLPSSFVKNHLTHDQPTSKDLIGFKPYAEAIRDFLTSPLTQGPISISIQAPWGAGKSSLMKMVRLGLDPKVENERKEGHATIRDVLKLLDRKHRPRSVESQETDPEHCWTIWFNAWKYESSEQVWAGLVDAIIAQVSDRLDPVEREIFLLKLNLARIDDGEVRKKIYDRLGGYLWPGAAWVVLGGVVAASALTHFGANPAGGVGLSAAALSAMLWRAWKNLKLEPAKFSLAEYVKVPEYGKSVGVIHQIHRDLERVVDVLPVSPGSGKRPQLVIFIDDLDRCSPNKVASIVEGINMFLASDQKNFLFVIGMDPQIVAAALEHAHKDIKGYLPPYEQTVPLGWRFMDKFVQLAFTIPPRTNERVNAFIGALAKPRDERKIAPDLEGAAKSVAAETVPTATAVPELPRIDDIELQKAASESVTEESEDVLALMHQIVAHSFFSPREIKRTLNFVRFVLLMRIGRFASGEQVPSLELYGRWIVLSMRWPDMARWLQWSSDAGRKDDLSTGIEGTTARRLAVLENAAMPDMASDVSGWCKAVSQQLGLQDGKVGWLADPELYQFFAAEAKRDASLRLSRAATMGFY